MLYKKDHIPWNKGKRGVQKGWRKGKDFPEDTKKKISETLKRRYLEGMDPWNKGKKHIKVAGENNCNWSGGSWRYWRKKTLERDEYTCQECGFNKEKIILIVDHIKPKSIYPELKLDIDNLITLCPNCHAIKSITEQKNIVNFKKRMNSGEPQTDNAVGNPEPSLEG